MKKIYPLLIAWGFIVYTCSTPEEKTKITSENYNPKKIQTGSFSGQPVEYTADSDTVRLTLKAKNGELKSFWSVLDGATPQQYAQKISSEYTDEDPSESHKIFHVAYGEVNGTNYMYMLAGQIGDIRYAERLVDFKHYRSPPVDK